MNHSYVYIYPSLLDFLPVQVPQCIEISTLPNTIHTNELKID